MSEEVRISAADAEAAKQCFERDGFVILRNVVRSYAQGSTMMQLMEEAGCRFTRASSSRVGSAFEVPIQHAVDERAQCRQHVAAA